MILYQCNDNRTKKKQFDIQQISVNSLKLNSQENLWVTNINLLVIIIWPEQKICEYNIDWWWPIFPESKENIRLSSKWTLIFPSCDPDASISESLLKSTHSTASSCIIKLSWSFYPKDSMQKISIPIHIWLNGMGIFSSHEIIKLKKALHQLDIEDPF